MRHPQRDEISINPCLSYCPTTVKSHHDSGNYEKKVLIRDLLVVSEGESDLHGKCGKCGSRQADMALKQKIRAYMLRQQP